MLGRKNYTRDEIDRCRSAVAEQLAAYGKLSADANLAGFEPLFFNNMVLVLDRYFVHRLRVVTGKDGNPLNEVELISDSLMNNGGVFRDSSVIKYVPEKSVLRLTAGDRIALSAGDFTRLSEAFFADLEQKFL